MSENSEKKKETYGKIDKTISTVKKVADVILDIVEDDKVGKMVFGTYSDGTTRSIPDAIEGEVYSPKTRGKAIKRNKKRIDGGRTKFQL